MQTETVAWGGWQHVCRITDGQLVLHVTLDVGPRVIALGFVGAESVFWLNPDFAGSTGDTVWRNYGGHRLWHAPEHAERTYQPDSAPVDMHETPDGVTFTPPVETATGIAKSLTIRVAEGQVMVRHRLTNKGFWPIQLAAWALSVMAPGGTAIYPLPPRGEHPRDLLPNTSLIFWPYSDLSDARWMLGRETVLLRQADGQPQKFGGAQTRGWLAYAHPAGLFIKQFAHEPDALYPDLGCSAEIFTNARMLELESLSPLTTLAPGQTLTFDESWRLLPAITPPQSDADVQRDVLPHIR